MSDHRSSGGRSEAADAGPTPAVSVIVVSFNTREMTLECLRSLYAETTDVTMEVLVVDNASSDGSAAAIADQFPQATLIASGENLGFGAANNVAAERARGRRLLLLNPDTVVLDRAVSRLVEFADAHSEAAIWGGRTVFADGTLNPGSCWGAPTLWSTLCLAIGLAHRFPSSRWLHPEALGAWQRDTVREVDVVSGCFLLIDAALWKRLSGFHPLFFMYGEDADLCLRARAVGARPLICPDAVIVHHGGGSERVWADKVIRLFTAKAQVFAIHWTPLRARIGLRLLDLWAGWRALVFGVVRLVRPRSRPAFEEWREIWRRRGAWHAAFDAVVAEQSAASYAKADTADGS